MRLTMRYTQKQLDAIRQNIKSGEQDQQAAVVRPKADPSMPDILPILKEEADGSEELSVPVNDGTGRGRAVYRRPKGGVWVEVTSWCVDPLTRFSVVPPEAVLSEMQQGIALIRSEFPSDDPDAIVDIVRKVCTQLNESGATIASAAIYRGYCAIRDARG